MTTETAGWGHNRPGQRPAAGGFRTRPELSGRFGMVSATHWQVAAAAMRVLEGGGNAFDAACAAGFVLHVVEPHQNGPGGEVPILSWSDAERRVRVVCGQGVMPASATLDRFAGLGLDLIPGDGLLPATVPGAFGGWTTLLERWGSWELGDVLAPAIELAGGGYPVCVSLSAAITGVADKLRTHWPTSAAAWLDDGDRAPVAGTLRTNRPLAATYQRVVAEAAGAPTREARIAAARDAWYRGFVAEAIDRFCRQTRWMDASGVAHEGLLTGDDLARWQVPVEDPATVDYAGVTVCKTGPWGQGPVLLAQLRLLEQLDVAALPMLSAERIHLIAEVAKLAFADREAWYGDPTLVHVPLTELLEPAYAHDRAGLVAATAGTGLRPGSPGGAAPRLPRLPRRTGVVEPAGVAPVGPGNGDTAHVDVVDRWGNMVAAMPSGGWLHGSPMIPELGFCLGTRGQMFWLEAGLASTLRPGARPRTTLSPTLVLRGGEPWLAFGSPGGDQQDQWQLPFLLRVVHGEADLQQAMDAPTFHTQSFPSSFYPRASQPGSLFVEDRLPAETVDNLRRRGHQLTLAAPWSLSRLCAVAKDGDLLRAAADARGGEGYAAGR